MCVRFH